MSDSILLGAVRYEFSPEVDPAFDELVQDLRAKNISMVGCVQRQLPDPGSCCPISHLEDLASGAQSRITQPLGSGSEGCRLDPGALANVSAELLGQLENHPQILILNRFGRGESEGRGFRSVIEKAVEQGIPILLAVKERYVPEWEAFSAGMATYLPADASVIRSWLEPLLAAKAAERDLEPTA